jgi:hypothetical protein
MAIRAPAPLGVEPELAIIVASTTFSPVVSHCKTDDISFFMVNPFEPGKTEAP